MAEFEQQPDLNINGNITVKFKIDEYNTVAQVYDREKSIHFILTDIAEKFQINSKYLNILHDAVLLPLDAKLFEFCHNEYHIIDVELHLNALAQQHNECVSNENEKIQLDCDVYYSHYQLPDFFSVYIPASDNGEMTAKRLIVEIINKPIVKPFLGGYIHKKTCDFNDSFKILMYNKPLTQFINLCKSRFMHKVIEYHDACSQTGPIIDAAKANRLMTRDTQTTEWQSLLGESSRSRAMQAFTNAASCVQKLTTYDHVIRAKRYKSYEQIENDKLTKIILIQRNFRRHVLEKRIKSAAAEWRRLYGEQQDREQQRKERLLKRFKEDCVVKAFPRTKGDFDVLFAQVQKWKESELARINATYAGAPRNAELYLLLEKEINLLNGIERQRSKVRQYLREQQIEKDLDEMGMPIKWIGYRDLVCEMDSLRTQHTRRLTNLYRRLKTPMVKGERIKFLSHLHEFLNAESNLPIVKELVDLLVCEKKLITIDVKNDALDSLRKRQYALFVAFIKRMKVEKSKDAEKRMCSKCKIVRPTAAFEIHTRQLDVNVCKSCNRLKRAPIDISIYRAILRAIRRDERKRNALSSSAFIVQEEDIREILETIWHGHSALSHCEKRKDLRLPRWNKASDWSPWNCICLTESESVAHLKVVDLEAVYDSHFLHDIRNKHELAKTMFKNLKTIDTEFVESGHWWNVGIAQKVV